MLKKAENSKKCCPNILFACPESVLDKSKARFRRLQNSPAAQTLVIADLALRQDLFVKTLSMDAQSNIWAKDRPYLISYQCVQKNMNEYKFNFIEEN
jgi:hypothetical protein